MMKPQENLKWNNEGKATFEEIKKSIAKAPTLVFLDFNKEFIMYCYASEHTLSVVLVQKNDEGMEARKVFPNLRSVLKVRGLRSPRSQRAVAEAQRPSQEFTPHQVAQPARTFLHPLKGKEDWKLSRAATVQAREENNV